MFGIFKNEYKYILHLISRLKYNIFGIDIIVFLVLEIYLQTIFYLIL